MFHRSTQVDEGCEKGRKTKVNGSNSPPAHTHIHGTWNGGTGSSAKHKRDFPDSKIPESRTQCSNGSFENGVIGALLADDLIGLLALAVIEIERSNNTTCS